MSRPKDLTFTLPAKRITLELWSSNFTRFTIPNKIIHTTLDNTVMDIKEIISIRSQEIGSDLNPRAIKVIYRDQERESHEPLLEFLEHVDYNERLRIEFHLDQLGARDIRPMMMNLVLRLSTGKKICTRETLQTTVSSLIETVVDHTDLTVDDIEHLEFNGGQIVTDFHQTLAELLELDIAPLGEMNFYVKKRSDFLVQLSTPNETIVRTNKFYAGLNTNIFIIKSYIIDQYTGPANITESDIKIIYFGRILSEASLLGEIFPTDTVNVILHFVIKEPELTQESAGFWSDLRKGKLFEFLPREPNPNFEAEVQRDERLRQRLRNGSVANHPANSVMVQDTQPTPNPVSTSFNFGLTSSTNSNEVTSDTPVFSDEAQLSGRSIEVASSHGATLQIDQTQTSSTTYKIKINAPEDQREVTLSSSQAIINDSDPENPYLMLSPSGYARLSSLGITIEKPQIVIEDEPARPTPTETYPQPQQGSFREQSLNQQQAQPNIPAEHPIDVGFGGAEIGFELRPRNPALQLMDFTRLLKFVFQSILVYFFIISDIPNIYLKTLAGLSFLIYSATRPTNRALLGYFLNLLPQNVRNITAPIHHLRIIPELRGTIGNLPTIIVDKLVSLLDETPRRSTIVQFLCNRFVEVMLFFTSFFMPFHNYFLIKLNERIRRQEERRERERTSAETSESVPDTDDFTPITEERGATGVQPHAEL